MTRILNPSKLGLLGCAALLTTACADNSALDNAKAASDPIPVQMTGVQEVVAGMDAGVVQPPPVIGDGDTSGADAATMDVPEEEDETGLSIFVCRGAVPGLLGPGEEICVDMPEKAGWTESAAQTKCAEVTESGTVEMVPSCAEACRETGQYQCVDPAADPAYFTYVPVPVWDCQGVPDFTELFGAPADNPSPAPDGGYGCYNDACATPIDDAMSISCRYSSQFTPENCADFPTSEGWTEADVETFCNTAEGSNGDAIVSVGDSCRKEIGGDGGALECMAVHEGKNWYGYGVPGGICLSVIPTDEGTTPVSSQGPFCDSY